MLSVHRGVNDSARNGIYLNIAGRKLFCQRFGKSIHTALRCRICHFTGRSDRSPHRSYVYYLTTMFPQHNSSCRFTCKKNRIEISTHYFSPICDTHIGKQAYVRYSCVVYDNIYVFYLPCKKIRHRIIVCGIASETAAFHTVLTAKMIGKTRQLLFALLTGQKKFISHCSESFRYSFSYSS